MIFLKKAVSLLLAAALMLSLSAGAWALELPDVSVLDEVAAAVEAAEEEVPAEETVTAEAEAPALYSGDAADSGTCGDSAVWTLSAEGLLTVSGTGTVESGSWSFDKEAVTAIVVEEGITELGDDCFESFVNVVEITLPSSLRVIGWEAFRYCMKLRSLTVPHGVTEIGQGAIWYCTSLGHLSLPVTLETVGQRTCFQCFELDHVSYAGTEEEWHAVDGYENVFIADTYPILFCFENDGSAVEHMDKCVTDIYYCGVCENFVGGLSKSTPTHNYRGGACRICGVSEEWTYTADNMGAVTVTKYSGTATEVEVPATFDGMPTRVLGRYVFQNNRTLRRVVLPEGLETLDIGAISNAYVLESVNLPSTLTTIGSDAFRNCLVLKSLDFPAGLTSVGGYAFSGCCFRESTLPDGVTSLGNAAFRLCDDMRCANLPMGLTALNKELFYNCTALAAVSFGGNVAEVGENVFGTCTALEHILFLGTEDEWWDMSVKANNGSFFDGEPCYGGAEDCLRLESDGLHEYVYCTACGGRFGEIELDLSYLDINDDGQRTAADVVDLIKYIAGAATDAMEDRVDVNSDGQRDILDVIRLIRLLAKIQ